MFIAAIEIAADLVGGPTSHVRIGRIWVRVVVMLAVGLFVTGVAATDNMLLLVSVRAGHRGIGSLGPGGGPRPPIPDGKGAPGTK